MLRIHTQDAPRADVGRPSVGQWCAAAPSSQPSPRPRPDPRPRPRPRPSSSPSPSPNPHEPGAPPRRSAVISCAASSSRWERSANCTRPGCSLQGCRRARCSACTGGRWASSAASCESTLHRPQHAAESQRARGPQAWALASLALARAERAPLRASHVARHVASPCDEPADDTLVSASRVPCRTPAQPFMRDERPVERRCVWGCVLMCLIPLYYYGFY